MISKEAFCFWSTLEYDLRIKIPCYIKNSFTLNELDSAAVFQLIDESDIEGVQNFIRTSLHDILLFKSKELGFHYGEKEYPYFFGSFMEDRSQFSFSSCDNLLIQLLIEHVKSFVKLQGEYNGFRHFNSKEHSQIDCTKYFFTDENSKPGELEEKKRENEAVKLKASNTHRFLYELISIADKNESRTKSGYRYSHRIRQFASYLRIISGRLAYQTIQKNIPLALSALSSTNRYIQGHDRVIEGQLRIKELSDYLKRRNLPRIVALSEDATRINGVPQYDSKVNEVLGFVLPLDGNGMPTPHSFPARNFNEIYGYFNRGTACAHFVNVIMAQPLANVPAFCILLFCSNSQYTAEDVAHRWEYISIELKKADIRVLAIASDSDPKYNSAMRKCTQLGSQSRLFENTDWFCMGAYEDLKNEEPVLQPYYIQDTIHIATKLRNMFLKTMKDSKMLPFGPKLYIQAKHIEFMMLNFTKDQHRLTANVLNREDKMNFDSVLRICDESVIKLLKSHVPDSEATVMFLQILRDVIDAYRDTKLSPLQRIEKIWYAVFILRIWKIFISSSKHSRLETNFLTKYCYSCIEINAHSLILVLMDLRYSNSSSLFMPHLLESQPCEAMFRQLRSMSTVYSTVTNCTLREIIDRVNRIELQSDIAATSEFVFPRIKTTETTPLQNFELPTNEQIVKQVQLCKEKAIEFATSIGLMRRTKKQNIDIKCTIPLLTFKTKNADHKNGLVDVTSESALVRNRNVIHLESLTLKNYADDFPSELLSEKSNYVEVPGVKRRKVIKKNFAGVATAL